MKWIIVFLLALLVSTYTYASRSLVLSPSAVTYQYESGHTLTIKTAKNGRKLASVEISNGSEVFSVPTEDLTSVYNPVLSSVFVVGGLMGSEQIENPSCVTIGYGAHHCYQEKCPQEVTYCFQNGKLTRYDPSSENQAFKS